MTQSKLDPGTELWHLFQKPAHYAFQATSAVEALQWQEQTRLALADTIGFQDERFTAQVEILERVDKGDYWREKWLLQSSEQSLMPVYYLQPKDVLEPTPTILALHGHGYGVKDIIGKWEDGSDREQADGIYRDFAVALCRQGFAVVAPEIACFGERQSDFSHLGLGQQAPTSCMHAAMLASHLGGSILGIRVRDCRKLIDIVEKHPRLDSNNLSVMGLSGGGMLAFFSSCLDERLKNIVISGYYSSFAGSILAMHHCACNYVPGLHKFGEMKDLVALLAPRPLFIEAGQRDPIFPIQAVRPAVNQAKDIYRLFGAIDNIAWEYFEGRHRIHGVGAYQFLAKCQRGEA